MLKIACVCLLIAAVVVHGAHSSSTAEKNAGEAIGKLLQEKISKKFRDAANEVKGVLVKHLGKSLKEAHSKMNPKPKPKKMHELSVNGAFTRHRKSEPTLPLSRKPCDEECRLKKMGHPAKCHACDTHNLFVQIQGASIHHNKSGRNRKDGSQMTQNGEGQGFGVPGPGSPPVAPGIPGPGGPIIAQPGSPMLPPGAPGSPMGGQPAQCGGTCPSTCAPSCDNTCCTGMQQACPSACIVSCFSYCPSQCCRK